MLEKQLFEANKILDEDFAKMNKKILDLDQLVFHEGSHINSNDKCIMPPGSQKIVKKGWEEIHVPA